MLERFAFNPIVHSNYKEKKRPLKKKIFYSKLENDHDFLEGC